MNFPYFDIHGDGKTIMSFLNLLKSSASLRFRRTDDFPNYPFLKSVSRI